MKLHLYEGGIRVPGILRFPGRVRPGEVSDVPVCSLDLLPTFCALAGIEPPAGRPLDGTSLVALWEGPPLRREQPLFWHYFRSIGPPKAALRDGSWTILGHWDQPQLGPGGSLQPGDMELIRRAELVQFELYDLQADMRQQEDRSASEPQRLRSLSEQLRQRYHQVRDEGYFWTVPPKE
jgi:arylsulfatase A